MLLWLTGRLRCDAPLGGEIHRTRSDMRPDRSFRFLLLTVMSSWVLGPAPTGWADPPSLMRYLPPGIESIILLPDVPATIERWKASPLSTQVDGSSRLRFPPAGLIPYELTEMTGLDPEELLGAIEDELIVGVKYAQADEETLGWLILLRTERAGALERQLLMPLLPRGWKTSREARHVSGRTYQRISFYEPLAPETDPDNQFALISAYLKGYEFYRDDHLLLIGSIKSGLLEHALESDEGRIENVPRLNLSRDADVVFRFSPGQVNSWIDRELREGGITRAGSSWLGLDTIRSLQGRVELQPTGVWLDLEMIASQNPAGIVELLLRSEGRPGAAERVPDDVAGYVAWTLPLPAVWTQLDRFLTSVDPDAAKAMDGFTNSLQEATGINLQDRLVASLGGEAVWFKPAEDTGKSVYLLELTQPTRFMEALDGILSYVQNSFQAFQLERYPLEGSQEEENRVLVLRRGRPGMNYRGKPFLYFGQFGNWLEWTTDPAGSLPGLIGMDSNLASNMQFQKMMTSLPGNRVAEAYLAPSLLADWLTESDSGPRNELRNWGESVEGVGVALRCNENRLHWTGIISYR